MEIAPSSQLANAADIAEAAAAARARGAARDRHRVHVRGALPRAAVPRPGGRRQPRRRRRSADLPDRRARRRSTSSRWPCCSATPRSRSCSTPGARTSRSCAAPGTPSSTTSSTPRSPPASPARSAQAGYGNLLGSVLGQRVGKTASYTRWDARPLTAEQLGYAAEDVAHLLAARRRDPAAAERQRPRGVGARGVPAAGGRPPTSATPRPPGSACRASASSIPARAPSPETLAAWRERTASDLDRPVGSIVADPALVELAKRQPVDARAGSSRSAACTRRRSSAGARRSSRRSSAGARRQPIPRDEARARSEPGDAPLIALAEALLRARALEAGLAYELIASRAELELIVGAARRGEPEPDVRTLSGWRARARRRRSVRPAGRAQRVCCGRAPEPAADCAG